MLRYVIRRLLFSIPVLLLASIAVFTVIRNTYPPLVAIALNPRITPEAVQRLREELGLNRSGIEQYTEWLQGFVTGDWGTSLISQRPVFPQVMDALGNTAVLGLVGVSISLLIGITIGTFGALRRYSTFDYLATGGAFFGLSLPTFWFALMVQLLFGVYLTRWLNLSEPVFYTTGMTAPGSVGFDLVDRLRHLALPVLVLSVQIIAVYSRYMRASLLEVLHSDYLRTARAKGVRESRVVVRHGMRNALIPVTTQLAIDVGLIAGGLIVTESIFAWPGMGRLFLRAVEQGDYPVILPWVMVTVSFVIVFNLVADILYAVLDPRIRHA